MDIFGSSNNVPRWLEDAAKPLDGAKLGAAINTSMADLYTSTQRNPEAPKEANWMDSRKGLAQAIFERNAAAQDPLWKQHLEIKQGAYLLDRQAKWLNMDATKKRMEVMDAGLKAKSKTEQDEAEDNQLIAGVVSEVGTNPQELLNRPMPALKSVKGRLAWNSLVTTAKASEDHLQTASDVSTLGRMKTLSGKEFTKRLGSLDLGIPEVNKVYAQIEQEQDPVKRHDLLAQAMGIQDQVITARNKAAGLEASKTTSGPTGTRTTYTAPKKTNLQMAQDYRDGIDPDLEPEAYAEADKAVKKLTVNPLDVVAAREVNTQANMRQRQQDRLALMGQAQQYRLDFAKMQQDAKAKVGGKLISEQQFIDRHLNGVLGNVTKNWDSTALGPVDSQKALVQATSLLKQAYRWTNPPAASQAAPPTAPASNPGTDAAPAAATPADTNAAVQPLKVGRFLVTPQ